MRKKSVAVLAAATCAAAAAGLTEASSASASSTTPYAYIQNLINRAGGTIVPFCEVTITQAPDSNPAYQTQTPSSVGWSVITMAYAGYQQLSGQGRQLFSDRQSSAGQPFDQGRADQLGLSLYNNPTTGTTTITLTALSWGGGQQQLTNLRMEDGVLLADGAAIGNQPVPGLFALSCGVEYIPG